MRQQIGTISLRLAAVTILLTFLSFEGFGQIRKYSNEFLQLGVGGRGFAMAGANVASTNDVTAGYWNPSGLALLQNKINLSFMHAAYFANIAKYDYLAGAFPLKDKDMALGLTLLRFGVDDIPNTLFLIEPDGSVNYNNITSFSVADYAFIGSFAAKIKKVEGLRTGVNFKVIHRVAGSFATAWGFGLDAGAQYDIGKFTLGAMARDITSTFNAWSFNFTDEEKEILVKEDNILPENSLEITVPRLILGGTYSYRLKDKLSIRPEVNIEMTTDGKRNVPIKTNVVSFDPRVGLEVGIVDIIFLRTGIGNIQSATNDLGEKVTAIQPNVGLGISFAPVSIDYSLTKISTQIDEYTHVISLIVRLK